MTTAKIIAERLEHRKIKKGSLGPDTTVYVSAIWWGDNDPIYRIVTLSAKKTEQLVKRNTKLEIQSAMEERAYEKKWIAEANIHNNGVHSFKLKDVVFPNEIPEAIQHLSDPGVWYAD